MTCILTFDLGTTFFKAVLFDDQLKPVALARVATPIDVPSPGRKQIDAASFVSTVAELTAQLRGQMPGSWRSIAAVSFATQANGVLLVDDADRALTPIMLWNDRRAADYVDRLREWSDAPDFYQRTGIPHCTDGFSPGKILWLRDHQPELLRHSPRFCLISDYLTLLLTGQHVTEAGVAGLTALLDIHSLAWRSEAITALGADALVWPRVLRAGMALGPVCGPLARELQIPEGAQFVVGCLDQYAGAIGTGTLSSRDLSETTGTVLATVGLSDRFDPALRAGGVFQGPAFREGWYHRMLFSEVSAGLFEAFRNTEAPGMDYDQLTALAAATPRGCEGLQLDPVASATQQQAVFSQDPGSWPLGHRVRAILEGVASVLRDQVKTVTGGVQPSHITAAGGGARSALWLQIKSELLGVPVRAADSEEPTSRGAAALALAAVSQTPVESVLADCL